MPKPMPATPTRRRGLLSGLFGASLDPANGHPRTEPLSAGRRVGVDKGVEVIFGYVVAEEGVFKSEGRGQFTRDSLRTILDCHRRDGGAKGLKVRYTHPSLSEDGLGKYLGRSRAAWLDAAGEVWKVRADLHVSPSSHDTPNGDLGGYVLALAAEDPAALSSSFVLDPEIKYVLNEDGTRKAGPDGEPLPPIWYCTKLYASDIVDTGDAVNDLLSAHSLSPDGLPGGLQRRLWKQLDDLFRDAGPDVIRARADEFLARYLAHRGGGPAGGGRKTEPAPPVAPPAPPPGRPADEKLLKFKQRYANDLTRVREVTERLAKLGLAPAPNRR
jgi:hypothetical protein